MQVGQQSSSVYKANRSKAIDTQVHTLPLARHDHKLYKRTITAFQITSYFRHTFTFIITRTPIQASKTRKNTRSFVTFLKKINQKKSLWTTSNLCRSASTIWFLAWASCSISRVFLCSWHMCAWASLSRVYVSRTSPSSLIKLSLSVVINSTWNLF